MRLLFELAFRNALRNVQRTLLTAMTVVFGTALLTLALAWQEGVFGDLTRLAAAGSGHVRLVDPDYAKREALFPLYENIPGAVGVAESIAAQPGVTGAYPRITAGVTLTAGEEIGDIFGLATGAPRGWYEDQLDVDQYLVEGRMMENDDELVVGSALVEKTGVKLNEELVLLGVTQDGAMSPVKGTVVGIVDAGNSLVDKGVYLTLEKMQYMADIGDGATEIVVYGEDYWEAAELAAAVAPGHPELLTQAWSERQPWAGILGIFGAVQWILSGTIVFITALGVWNTMMMSVLERTGEIGVMRAMGLGRLGAVALFVVEALTIATLGGALGVSIGALGGWYLESHGVSLGDRIAANANMPMSSTMYGDINGGIVVTAFLLGLLMAVIGSALPALRAASIQPVAAMRARR